MLAYCFDIVVLDPPKFGRGPEGELWRLEDHLAPLLADCRRLLDTDSRFLVLTVYAVRMSALAIAELLRQLDGQKIRCVVIEASNPRATAAPGTRVSVRLPNVSP